MSELRTLPLATLTESPRNQRTHYDAAKLRELADSIKNHGLHQPILVRPLPGSRVADTDRAVQFEIVAGHRRFRASHLAGMPDIMAVVREMNDATAMEAALIENLQREGLSPLEEAEGYEQLMQHTGMNADQVGGKISRSRAYVYGRLKLLDLCQAARKALADGLLDHSRALLIARIPNEKLQGKALNEITNASYGREAMSARQAAEYIQRNFMLALNKARFTITDATLVPAAGACSVCPKRTGSEPDLFLDVDSADVCTDPTCYGQKEEAQAALLVAKAKEQGQNVIAGKEAQELVAGGGYGQTKYKGYRRLDVADDSPTDQPLRKIIGAQMKAEGIEPTMIEHATKKGELVAALPNELVLKLLKTVDGQAQAAKTVAKEVRAFSEEKKAKADAKAKAQYEQAWRNQLLARAWDEISNGDVQAFTTEVHRELALRFVSNISTDDAEAICKLLGLGTVGAYAALNEHIRTCAAPEQVQLLMVMQRDSGTDSCSYRTGERVENVGLMLVAGIVFGDGLAAQTSAAQARAMAEYFPEVKEGRPDLPLRPAAQAGGVRGKAKAEGGSKKPRGPAAPAAKPKASAEETSQGIAAALQCLEAGALAAEGNDSGAAAASQGIEASAPADATSAGVDMSEGAAAAAASPFPDASASAEAPSTGAPDAAASSTSARVLYRCPNTGSNWTGRGKKPRWLEIALQDGKKLGDYLVAPAAADRQRPAIAAGNRVKVVAVDVSDDDDQAAYLGREGVARTLSALGVWAVMFPGKKGGVAEFGHFLPNELEVVE